MPAPVPHILRSRALAPGFAAGLLLCTVVPASVLYILASVLAGVPDWGFLIGTLAIGSLAAIASYGLVRLALRFRRETYQDLQEERDAYAQAVAKLLEAGDPTPPYSLYLRPFFTDGHLTAEEGSARYLSLDANDIADWGQKHDFERASAQALEKHSPLISLGRPNTRLGAGRIETDDDNWKPLFEKLIGNADRVLMVPIGQPATMEEVQTIAMTPELREKTVFLRPANRRSRDFTFAPDTTIRSLGGMWDWTRKQILDVFPQFPPFSGGPRLFAVPGDGKPSVCTGNGMCSVQQPSGLHTFLVEGRRAFAGSWIVPLLLLCFGLLACTIHFDLDVIRRSGGPSIADPSEARQLVQLTVLELGILIPLLMLAAYKFITGDYPRKLGTFVKAALFAFFLSGVLPLFESSEAATLEFTTVRFFTVFCWRLAWSLLVYGTILALAQVNAQFWHLLAIAAIALVGVSYEYWRFAELAAVIEITDPQEYELAVERFLGLLSIVGGVRAVVLTAVVMAVPVVTRANALKTLGICLAGAAIYYGATLGWSRLVLEPHFDAFEFGSCGVECGMAWARTEFLLSYLGGMFHALPILATGLVLGHWAVDKGPKHWSVPL